MSTKVSDSSRPFKVAHSLCIVGVGSLVRLAKKNTFNAEYELTVFHLFVHSWSPEKSVSFWFVPLGIHIGPNSSEISVQYFVVVNKHIWSVPRFGACLCNYFPRKWRWKLRKSLMNTWSLSPFGFCFRLSYVYWFFSGTQLLPSSQCVNDVVPVWTRKVAVRDWDIAVFCSVRLDWSMNNVLPPYTYVWTPTTGCSVRSDVVQPGIRDKNVSFTLLAISDVWMSRVSIDTDHPRRWLVVK